MKTVQEIRLENLGKLVREHRDGFAGIARDASCNETYLRQIWSRQPESKTGEPRGMGASLARKIEGGLKLPHGWMDADHTRKTLSPAAIAIAEIIDRLDPAERLRLSKIIEAATGYAVPDEIVEQKMPVTLHSKTVEYMPDSKKK